MDHPTWGDVKIPIVLVDFIKGTKPCYFLDSLVHQFVFRNKRKAYYTYLCSRCGYAHRPERALEEIACCPNCNSVDIHGSPQLRWSKEIPRYSRSLNYNPTSICLTMAHNYTTHFRRSDDSGFTCGWKYGTPYAQFPGGDMAFDNSPRLSIIKAAVLAPYLWDMSFNWGNQDDTMNTEHLTPILHYFSNANYFKPAR